MSICIAGAGVIGLTCADQMLDSHNDIHTLTIVSEHFPSDTPISHAFTSPWAGAHFRPSPCRAGTYDQDKLEAHYASVTYNHFKSQSKGWLEEGTIEFMDGIDWLENPSYEYETMAEGYNNASLENFSIEKDLPNGVKMGFKYKAWCLNAPEYLKFLKDQIEKKCNKLGILLRIKRVRLDKLSQIMDLYTDVDLIVNASGRGLQWSGGFDPKTFFIRGQTLLLDVSGSRKHIRYDKATITHQDRDGNWTFVIKRPGKSGDKAYYILGGTKQPKDHLIMPRENDTKDLLERGRRLFPDLLESFDIVNINVGFRPSRNEGPRVELEVETLENGLRIPVIHAYGFGGFGFQDSVGAAHHVLELLKRSKPGSKL